MQNNHFVGATAKYDTDGNIFQVAPDDLLPDKYIPFHRAWGLLLICVSVVPDFRDREECLKRAAQCTCAIVGQDRHDGKLYTYTGTAFFVGPTTLVTAGHCAPTKHAKLIAQPPGTAEAAMDPFQVLDGSIPNCFSCTISATLYAGENKMESDISILECKNRYKADKWLEIETNDFEVGVGIDVIGYPGNYEVSLANDPDIPIPDVPRGRRFTLASQILPRWQLSISYGFTLSNGDNPTYNLSTVGGMSGGPVLRNGKVIGEFL